MGKLGLSFIVSELLLEVKFKACLTVFKYLIGTNHYFNDVKY
jgi:hypothetical protein